MVSHQVGEIDLKNFRGWADEHQLNLNADLVLITAANGRGKSSLLEALSRALGGVGVCDDAQLQTLPVQGSSEQREGWSVQVKGHDTAHTINQATPKRALDPYEHPGPQTVRRATYFTQDPLNDQFEDPKTPEDTVLGFLAPFPKWLDTYATAVNDEIERIGRRQPGTQGTMELNRATRRRDDALTSLLEPLLKLVGGELPEGDDDAAKLATLARRLPSTPELRPLSVQSLRKLDAALREHLRDRRADAAEIQMLLEQRARVEREIKAQDAAWPEAIIEALVTWAPARTVDLDRLLELLTGLANPPERWVDRASLDALLAQLPAHSRRASPQLGVIHALVEALATVDLSRATRARDGLDAWQVHWQVISAKHKALRSALDRLKLEIDRLTNAIDHHEAIRLTEHLREQQYDLDQRTKELEHEKSLRTKWPTLEPLREALIHQRQLCARLRAAQLDDSVKREVQQTMNAVMTHFVVAGLTGDPIQLHQEGSRNALTPNFSDGRQLDAHLSTGQKAQDALAWLLSTNALLQKWLPHRLLLLDDPSTALDLTNLAAQCALLRKFAYAEKSSARKRQVVITSHHDQLTHRIYDQMLPPKGYTMLEIRLEDWSMEAGPKVNRWTIKPTGEANYGSRKRLADALGAPP